MSFMLIICIMLIMSIILIIFIILIAILCCSTKRVAHTSAVIDTQICDC
jgi:hypothetical protein